MSANSSFRPLICIWWIPSWICTLVYWTKLLRRKMLKELIGCPPHRYLRHQNVTTTWPPWRRLKLTLTPTQALSFLFIALEILCSSRSPFTWQLKKKPPLGRGGRVWNGLACKESVLPRRWESVTWQFDIKGVDKGQITFSICLISTWRSFEIEFSKTNSLPNDIVANPLLICFLSYSVFLSCVLR